MAIFPKGLTHSFGLKMAIFPTFFFQVIQVRKMSFKIFQNKKTRFQTIKTRSSNSRKIEIFPKGLTHGCGLRMAIFPTFFFSVIQARKMSFTIFENEKTPVQPIKTRISTSRKMAIFPNRVNPCFWSKNDHFSNFFCQVIQARKMSFTIFQNEETPFQAIKTRSSKVQKWPFLQKGSTMVLLYKWPFFQFFFQVIQARKMSFTIFQNEKTPFQAIKTRRSNSRRIEIFPMVLVRKWPFFHLFFFRQYRPGKCLL